MSVTLPDAAGNVLTHRLDLFAWSVVSDGEMCQTRKPHYIW